MSDYIYLSPEDVVVRFVGGLKTAKVNFELPVIWTDEALHIASVSDYLSGWVLAREAYRNSKTDDLLRGRYPKYWEEAQRAKVFKGSVTEFRDSEELRRKVGNNE